MSGTAATTVRSGAQPGSPTPDTWRAAAIAILVGGLLVGDRAAGGRAVRGATGLAAALAPLAALPIARASRRPPIRPAPQDRADDAELPTMSVLVAARDEASVIERLIEDLAAQDHRTAEGRPRFELIIVDDRSIDGTAQVALRAAARAGIGDVTRFVRRAGDDLPDGKGAALSAIPPEDCRGDVVTVLDADARIGPSYLRTLAGYVAAGAGAVTARRRVLAAGSSSLAGAQADEQTVDGLIQRGRWALAGCSEFRGNGITLRRELLARVGGWRSEALTEDLDLSARVAAETGVRVAWAIDAEAWEEPVGTVDALWRQRVRWAEGAIRRVLEHGPAVVGSTRLSPFARLDFATYAAQLALPPIVWGVILGSLRRGRPGPAIVLLGGYASASCVLAWDALRWEHESDGAALPARERARRAGRVTVFGSIWLAAVPAALWRLATRSGPVRYEKMVHGETTP